MQSPRFISTLNELGKINMDSPQAMTPSDFFQKFRALFGIKERAPLPWPIVDKSWKLTYVYTSRQQVAEIIAKAFESQEITSAENGVPAAERYCPVINALVPKGNAWNEERAFGGSIGHLAWKYPHFERIFASRVFNEAFLGRAQNLGKNPQNWSGGRLTDVAWLQYEKLARQYGVKLEPRTAFSPRVTADL